MASSSARFKSPSFTYLVSSFFAASISFSLELITASCSFYNSSYDFCKLSFFSFPIVISRLSALISTAESLFALSSACSRLVHFSWNIRTLSVKVRSVEITREKSRQTRETYDSNSDFWFSSSVISRFGWVSISALN